MGDMFKRRQKLIVFLFCALFVLILYRLVSLQVVQGEYYDEQSRTRLSRSTRITAPRGEILDCYGRPLVTNKTGFFVEIQKSDADDATLNQLILNLISVVENAGSEYTDNLEISFAPYTYQFYQYEGAERDEKIYELGYDADSNRLLSAPEKIAQLAEKYGVDKQYAPDDVRRIVGVRYEMEYRNFSAANSYTFASDVGVDVVSVIKEQQNAFPNVDIVTQPVRQYANGNLAAHVLGRVGKIYKEEYEALEDEGYSMNAIIGKDGMEKYLEKDIRGIDGTGSVQHTLDGVTTEIWAEVPPTPGNNAVLTLDLDLQKAAEEALAKTIDDLYYGGRKDASPRIGSVVAMDVNTGGVLAMASYPTYDPSKFDSMYMELYNDPLKPMFNRAISGTYAPGSVFKILTSIAALEEHIITPYDRIQDRGVFKLFDQSFNCWIYTDTGTTHGNVNVSEALRDSCNYFYYSVGNQMGIETLAAYGEKIGLGSLTGIEIEGEAKGVLATPEYKEKTFDTIWYPGDTVQAAIGQSFNLFTPLQLASFVSTFANGGTRYQAHLLDSIKRYSDGKDVKVTEPKILGKLEIAEETYRAIADGMRMVAATGTASQYFGNFPVKVCCKTGSAQVGNGDATGVFVAFAPYDDPEIAVAIVVENAGSGSAVAPIAKSIFAEYFGVQQAEDADQPNITTGTEE